MSSSVQLHLWPQPECFFHWQYRGYQLDCHSHLIWQYNIECDILEWGVVLSVYRSESNNTLKQVRKHYIYSWLLSLWWDCGLYSHDDTFTQHRSVSYNDDSVLHVKNWTGGFGQAIRDTGTAIQTMPFAVRLIRELENCGIDWNLWHEILMNWLRWMAS